MLSRLSGNTVRRGALRSSASRVATAQAKRTFVQPSQADRASVVDVPSTYQEDAFFAPRAGMLVSNKCSSHSITLRFVDMLGFKLELPQRGNSVTEQARPIYLDMQVGCSLTCHVQSLQKYFV